jgi:hypothetical protein
MLSKALAILITMTTTASTSFEDNFIPLKVVTGSYTTIQRQ